MPQIVSRQTGIPIRETADGERDPLAAVKDLAEAEWEGALILFFQEQSARIRAKLEPGIPKSRKALEDLGDRLTDRFWEHEDRELLAVMAPRLTAGALTGVTGAAAIVDGLGLGVDWTLANMEAAKWAREYAGQLIGVNTGGINATTRRQVGERVAEFIETPGMTMDDLFDRLNTSDFSFGPVRSRMIAVTEVTRSYWEGNKAGSRWAEDEGYFKWRKQWQTLRDELVCVLCGPLHGVTVDGIDALFPDGAEDGPPRHPNCRCFLTQSPIVEEVAEEGEEPQITTENALRRVEDRTFDSNIEIGTLFDDSGNQLFERRGDRTSVPLTLVDQSFMKDGYFTHNHPSGSSFSKEDISTLIKRQAREFRAVGTQTVDGLETRYRYIMRRKDIANYPPQTAEGIVRATATVEERAIMQQSQAAINAGEISVSQASGSHHHVLWQRTIKELQANSYDWLEYSREVW